MIRLSSFGEIYRPSSYKTVQDVTSVQMKQTISPAAPVSKTDKVQISAEGSFKSLLTEMARTVNQEVSTNTAQRVQTLKGLVDSGKYQVPASAIANAMLNRAALPTEETYE